MRSVDISAFVNAPGIDQYDCNGSGRLGNKLFRWMAILLRVRSNMVQGKHVSGEAVDSIQVAVDKQHGCDPIAELFHLSDARKAVANLTTCIKDWADAPSNTFDTFFRSESGGLRSVRTCQGLHHTFRSENSTDGTVVHCTCALE